MNIIRLNSIGEPFAKSGQATPPSGGGTEGGSELKYYHVSTDDSIAHSFISTLCVLCKGNAGGQTQIVPKGIFGSSAVITDFAVDWSLKCRINGYDGNITDVMAFMASGGELPKDNMTDEEKKQYTQIHDDVMNDMSSREITEEQFYTL